MDDAYLGGEKEGKRGRGSENKLPFVAAVETREGRPQRLQFRRVEGFTKDAIAATLRQVAALTSGSTLAMTYILPLELADPEERPMFERALKGARAAGTPFISFFYLEEMLALARAAGFRDVRHVSAAALARRYFAGRTDGFRPPSGEELLVAST